MTQTELRILVSTKSTAKVSLPDDANFNERIYSALKRVALDTLPLVLIENTTSSRQILRRIDEDTFVRVPEKPTNGVSIIDTDIALEDAVALYIMAGLERAKAKTHMGLYWKEIDTNNERLIETHVSVATNEYPSDFANPRRVTFGF